MHLETSFAQNMSPRVQGEYPQCPVIGLNPKASMVANEIQYRCFILFICRVGIVHVLDEDDVDSVSRERGGAGSVLLECLNRHVRCGHKNAARFQVGRGSSECCREIRKAIHVRYRVVHQGGIEGTAEAERPHVSLDKRALRIQFLRLCEHDGTQIDTGNLEQTLEVRNVLAAPAANVQQGDGRTFCVLTNQLYDVPAIVCVLSGGIAPHGP